MPAVITRTAINKQKGDTIMVLFRELTKEEERAFKASARESYEPLTEIKGIWHPIYQREGVKMNEDFNLELQNKSPVGEEGDV